MQDYTFVFGWGGAQLFCIQLQIMTIKIIKIATFPPHDTTLPLSFSFSVGWRLSLFFFSDISPACVCGVSLSGSQGGDTYTSRTGELICLFAFFCKACVLVWATARLRLMWVCANVKTLSFGVEPARLQVMNRFRFTTLPLCVWTCGGSGFLGFTLS